MEMLTDGIDFVVIAMGLGSPRSELAIPEPCSVMRNMIGWFGRR